MRSSICSEESVKEMSASLLKNKILSHVGLDDG